MRWRILLLAILIVALVVLAIADSAGRDAEWAQILGRGDAYRDAYLYTAATDQYLQALDQRPHNPIVLVRLCDVWWRRGQPDDAVVYADRAEGVGANRSETAECRAHIAEARGRAGEAAAQWSIVAAERPDDRDAHLRSIDALIDAHEWASATAQAQALLDANPDDEAALLYRGALLALDDPLRAQPYLRAAGTPEAAALASALDEPIGLANRSYRAVSIGRVFLEYDRLSLAWRAFVAATTDNPGYADAFAYLGMTYDRLGEATLAGAYLDRAVELDSESVVALYLRGVYLSRHARWAEARVDLTRASYLDPENAPVAFALGRVLAEQQEYSTAEEYFNRAVAREPDNAAWQLALAEFYIGRLVRLADTGVPAAQRAVELAPDSAPARTWLGWGLHLLGDDAQAEFELRVAIDLDPALARARLHLGNLLIDVGRIEEGRTELFRAADLDPQGEVGARARQLLGEP